MSHSSLQGAHASSCRPATQPRITFYHFIRRIPNQDSHLLPLRSEMELLTTSLFVILLTATSATPMGWRQHHDADIADGARGWMDENSRWISRSRESFGRDDSSESSESRSSESESSEESSEEVFVTDWTTPTAATADMTTEGDGSGRTPKPNTMSPVVTNSTRVVDVTPPCDGCFTVEIPTGAPITDVRGDN